MEYIVMGPDFQHPSIYNEFSEGVVTRFRECIWYTLGDIHLNFQSWLDEIDIVCHTNYQGFFAPGWGWSLV